MPLKVALILLFASLCVQCGSDDDSAEGLTISTVSGEPIVFPDDSKVIIGYVGTNKEPEYKDLKGPWFKVFFSLKNETGKCIYIVAMRGTVYNSVGEEVNTFTIEPSEIFSETGDTKNYLYALSYANESGTVQECFTDDEIPEKNIITETNPWFINGLVENDDGSYIYRIVIEPIGWFGDEDTQEERLYYQMDFTTR